MPNLISFEWLLLAAAFAYVSGRLYRNRAQGKAVLITAVVLLVLLPAMIGAFFGIYVGVATLAGLVLIFKAINRFMPDEKESTIGEAAPEQVTPAETRAPGDGHTIRVLRVSTTITPRAFISKHHPSAGDLPIRGGWGYSIEDAVVIDMDDPAVVDPSTFNGVGIEYVFVEKRIYDELIVTRQEADQYAGITWNLIKQRLMSVGDQKFDEMEFEVCGFRVADWNALKAEWEGPDGATSGSFDKEAHERKRQRLKGHYTATYYFDVTSFFGRQNLIFAARTSAAAGTKRDEEITRTGGENIQLVNADEGTFSILGLVVLRLFEPYIWKTQDVEQQTCRGADCRAYRRDDTSGRDIASVLVVDATDDPEEPNIEELNPSGVEALDRTLRTLVERDLVIAGTPVTEWMSSQLNETTSGKGLVTPYVVFEEGKKWQYITLRIRAKGRNVVVLGAFDFEAKATLAAPMFSMMRTIQICD